MQIFIEGKGTIILLEIPRLGYEGAGVVEKTGANVQGISVGDPVAFADEKAASVLLQGLNAHYLTKDSYAVKENDVILVQAAAGGVGQLLVQIAKLFGGRVIGLTSSMEKASAVKNAGGNQVFLYSDDWKRKVMEETSGKGGQSLLLRPTFLRKQS